MGTGFQQYTLLIVIVGGYDNQGWGRGGNFMSKSEMGGCNTWGEVEKSEKWSKFGQELHEFERIGIIFCILGKQ